MKNEKKSNGRTAEQDGAHLNWRYQDKAYNDSFKKWRREKRDSVGFYFVENPGLNTYQDGVGFINDYPEAHEAKAFRKVLAMLGLILVYRVAVDMFFLFFMPYVMEKMGMDIHYSFFGGQRSGSQAIMMLLDIASQILGRIVPTAILVKHLEIPFSVILPTKVTNKPMFRFSVPAALLTAGVCSVLSFFLNNILSMFRIDVSKQLTVSADAGGLLYVIIAQTLIVPIVSELCTHGVILQAVRQFGDGTALCFTSIVIAASTYDITQFFFAAASAFVIGYFIIRTGSVITGIIMRVTIRACIYVLSYLAHFVDPLYSGVLIRAFIFLILSVGLVFTVRFLYIHSDSFSMTIKADYMSFGRKVLETATSVPIVIWFTLTFLVTAHNIKFIF